MDKITSERQPSEHFLVHFSDTHFLSSPNDRLHGVADFHGNLQHMLDDLESLSIPPEALIFTGDLTDVGDSNAYALLRNTVQPSADRMGARVIWAMGNHDSREAFRNQLLKDDSMVSDDATEPVDYVVWLGGLRIITLDTSVPGSHHGEISESQYEWLAQELATPAPEGSILVMHHPPVPCLQTAAVSVELRGQQQLLETLHGKDIRTILAGHLHYSTHAMFGSIPVSVSMGSCYTQDLLMPLRGTRGRDAHQGFNFVHVYPDTVMHTAVFSRIGRTVGREIPGETYAY